MTYDFGYGPDTPYARAVSLLGRHHRCAGGVVVDLGCGFGAIAEPVAEMGFGYLGVDVDPAALKALSARGFEHVEGDLRASADVLARVEGALGGRAVAAVAMLDVIEHLADAEVVLEAVGDFARRAGLAPLVVSIPNVTHLDLAVKLLMGRWDVTPTGLLDSTHVRFFSEAHLARTMESSGWHQVASDDFEQLFSDQWFPADAVPLQRGTALGALLAQLRHMSGQGALVNQFVRAYVPADRSVPAAAADPLRHSAAETRHGPAPFLSVLVRTKANRPATLQESLLALAAQTSEDFEVLVLAHDVDEELRGGLEELVGEFHEAFSSRVRIVPVAGGGRARPINVGAEQARGRYLAMLDDDDLVLAHWVEELAAAEGRAPGHVLRIGVAVQDVVARPGAWDGQDGYDVVSRPRIPFPLEFDFAEHCFENWTPNNGYAVPRSLVTDLHQQWDESLEVLEDWDYLLRAAFLCGVESVPTFGALVRSWANAENSITAHSDEAWQESRRRIVAKLDGAPFVLDQGALGQIRRVVQSERDAWASEADARFVQRSLEKWVGELQESQQSLAAEVAALHARLEAATAALVASEQAHQDTRARLGEVLESTSWRMTRLLRLATGTLRRTGGGISQRPGGPEDQQAR